MKVLWLSLQLGRDRLIKRAAASLVLLFTSLCKSYLKRRLGPNRSGHSSHRSAVSIPKQELHRGARQAIHRWARQAGRRIVYIYDDCLQTKQMITSDICSVSHHSFVSPHCTPANPFVFSGEHFPLSFPPPLSCTKRLQDQNCVTRFFLSLVNRQCVRKFPTSGISKKTWSSNDKRKSNLK